MKYIDGIAVFGTHDENTLEQARDVASRAERMALMGDAHLGYYMPVGGVAAYSNQVSIAGVGVDIGCGNCAIKTDLVVDAGINVRAPAMLKTAWWPQLADEIQNTVSFGVGRTNGADDAPVDDDLFKADEWDIIPAEYRDKARGSARAQLGTVGGGNHYVDVFVDEAGHVWVGVHFGSRGFGHNTAQYFMARSQGFDLPWGTKKKEVECLVGLDTQLGQDYWALMELAGRYAYVGREWVARKVVELLGARELDMVHNHHNFAWKEVHSVYTPDPEGGSPYVHGQTLVVVRKGATPAFPGQRGFVGGSMGDDAVILQGAKMDPYIHHWNPHDDTEQMQEAALYSTVHGAGRVMSRNEAAGPYRGKGRDRRRIGGTVSREDRGAWLKEKGVILRGGGLDEAPQAYRRLPDVLAAQGPTIEVLQTLRPLVVVMALADEHDPWKD